MWPQGEAVSLQAAVMLLLPQLQDPTTLNPSSGKGLRTSFVMFLGCNKDAGCKGAMGLPQGC